MRYGVDGPTEIGCKSWRKSGESVILAGKQSKARGYRSFIGGYYNEFVIVLIRFGGFATVEEIHRPPANILWERKSALCFHFSVRSSAARAQIEGYCKMMWAAEHFFTLVERVRACVRRNYSTLSNKEHLWNPTNPICSGIVLGVFLLV